MSVFKNGTFYHFEFVLDGRRRRGSTGTANKPLAIAEERLQCERLKKSYCQILEEENREQRRKTIQQAADEFLADYQLKHESATFAVYALGHVSSLLGGSLVVEITPNVVKRYQADRLKEKAGPKTINDEVQLLLRLCGEQGALIRATLHRDKALKLALPPSPGRPYSTDEKARMLEEAQKLRTPMMCAALALDLNTGLRDKELRQIRWDQIDLVHKKALTVGKSKTEAGTGRVILGIFNDDSVVSNLSHYPFGPISLPFQEVFPHGQSVRIKQPGFVMRHQFELRRATPRLLGADQHSQELGPAGLPRLARQPLLNDPP